jgi:hypothetical protein
MDMIWAWTWSGQCFGYWDGDDLWTHHGKHIGRRSQNEIFGPQGWYVGEVMHNGRLSTNKAKAARQGSRYTPSAARAARDIPHHDEQLIPYLGFQDFPHPDEF